MVWKWMDGRIVKEDTGFRVVGPGGLPAEASNVETGVVLSWV